MAKAKTVRTKKATANSSAGKISLPDRFDWDALHLYRKTQQPWPPSYPAEFRDFFSPDDGPGIHQLLVNLVASATKSVVLNMYGYDDDDIDAEIRKHTLNPKIYVQMSLDKSQSGGKHEQAILAEWNNDAIGNSIAIGQSMKHAISLMKILIIDGEFVISGSTNWSISGEEKQDNQITIIRTAIVAATYRAILDINHTEMLKQMAHSGSNNGSGSHSRAHAKAEKD
jgi:phosphatidylserine/phosphatidylglycerophosphate/cardiolipin synthase-like enzyme